VALYNKLHRPPKSGKNKSFYICGYTYGSYRTVDIEQFLSWNEREGSGQRETSFGCAPVTSPMTVADPSPWSTDQWWSWHDLWECLHHRSFLRQ